MSARSRSGGGCAAPHRDATRSRPLPRFATSVRGRRRAPAATGSPPPGDRSWPASRAGGSVRRRSRPLGGRGGADAGKPPRGGGGGGERAPARQRQGERRASGGGPLEPGDEV